MCRFWYNTLRILSKLKQICSTWSEIYISSSRLERKLTDVQPFVLKVLSISGKIEICLRKGETERWNGIGASLTGSETWMPQEKLVTEVKDFQVFRPWKLISKKQITPDVRHYVFQSSNQVNLFKGSFFSNHLTIWIPWTTSGLKVSPRF